MGRAPCCEKMGLKKGPWTPEEDRVLINYIRLHGHTNWRALPKQAGLLRCGKSCRLRWINYLRPDIKRGNFTPEEEDTIINLHGVLGNRWSAIAAKLPGRTDNEIKNVWHTHLKKRIKQKNHINIVENTKDLKNSSSSKINEALHNNNTHNHDQELDEEQGEAINVVAVAEGPTSPQQYSNNNSDDTADTISTAITLENVDDNKDFALLEDASTIIDESFWSDEAVVDDCITVDNNVSEEEEKIEVWESPLGEVEFYNDDVEFWFGLLSGVGELSGISDQIHL